MNVYSNPALDLSVTDTVQIAEGEKQNKVQYKDILFTGSSETPEESGMTSVVTQEVQEDYYLNSFCFGLRLYNPELFNADFLKHYFRSHEARKAIARTASGVTRFNVSKAKAFFSMAKSPCHPARYRPSDRPPHPAKRSITVYLRFWGILPHYINRVQRYEKFLIYARKIIDFWYGRRFLWVNFCVLGRKIVRFVSRSSLGCVSVVRRSEG